MCGIVGIVGKDDVALRLVESLTRLEYRGYDSCGVATLNSQRVEVRKDIGSVNDVARRNGLALSHGNLGIAHTRWATHGGVTQSNAHPHLSCDGNFAVVHNGIITNHRALRQELETLGHRFASDTDTEVLCHLLEEMHRAETSIESCFVTALRRLRGTFAVVMLSTYDRERIFSARNRSPLILGVSPEANFVGSDINAFLPYTKKAVVLDDGQYAVLCRATYTIRAIADGEPQNRVATEIGWSAEGTAKDDYAHYMEKEICEQPQTVRNAIEVSQADLASLARLMLASPRKILTGVGTTYFVALFGQYLFSIVAGEPAIALSSDEAETLAHPDADTALLAISQSGETYDTLETLRHANASNARTAAIVNVPGSSMTREAGFIIQQNSGPEICVISTKAAMAQLILLLRLAVEMARLKQIDCSHILAELHHLPQLLERTLETQRERTKTLAALYHQTHDWFFLGRGLHTPIAFETALKMKEVTYLHAEGMPAGFLKHGTLSLIDDRTVSVFLIPPQRERALFELTISSAEEVRARNGKVIAFSFEDPAVMFDEQICLPKTLPVTAPLLQLLVGQLLAYETALTLGRNIDRPRSLAKSVTVA